MTKNYDNNTYDYAFINKTFIRANEEIKRSKKWNLTFHPNDNDDSEWMRKWNGERQIKYLGN